MVSVFLNYLKFGFGSHGHAPNPKIVRMVGGRVFPKWNLKVTSPKPSRIIMRSFWAPLFSKFIVKMVPQTPQTPTPDFSWIFVDFPSETLVCFVISYSCKEIWHCQGVPKYHPDRSGDSRCTLNFPKHRTAKIFHIFP